MSFLIIISLLLSSFLQLYYTPQPIPIEEKRLYKITWPDNDVRQEYVNKAYQLGGMDFVKLIECERYDRNPKIMGDGGDAIGLCQMNKRYHKIPEQYYTDPFFQIEYCYEKRKQGTPFYGPERDMGGVPCYVAVEKYFILK